MEEIWYPIDPEGWYEITKTARARSWKSKGFGVGRRLKKPKEISGSYDKETGRTRLSMFGKMPGLADVMLTVFVSPRPSELHEACHNDGNPENNHLDNLRWDTAKANQADRILHGTDLAGEKSSNAKLTNELVTQLRREYLPEITDRKERKKRGLPSQRELAKRHGISQKNMGQALRGETYRDA